MILAMVLCMHDIVTPAKAGGQYPTRRNITVRSWIPACAEITNLAEAREICG